MKHQHDHSWDEVLSEATRQVRMGHRVYQKFTCSGCKARLGMDVPNTFYTHGTCDQCKTITNIQSQGHNYLLHIDKNDIPNPLARITIQAHTPKE